MKNKETEYKLVTISTLIILLILLFLSVSSYAQCLSVINKSKNMYTYSNTIDRPYINGSINVMQLNNMGVDFDVEIGYLYKDFAFYGFYGNHNERSYTNYGAGVDYKVLNWNPVDIFIGLNATGIAKPTQLTKSDIHYLTGAIRGKFLFKITDIIGLTIVPQYQERPGVFEINAGLQINLQ